MGSNLPILRLKEADYVSLKSEWDSSIATVQTGAEQVLAGKVGTVFCALWIILVAIGVTIAFLKEGSFPQEIVPDRFHADGSPLMITAKEYENEEFAWVFGGLAGGTFGGAAFCASLGYGTYYLLKKLLSIDVWQKRVLSKLSKGEALTQEEFDLWKSSSEKEYIHKTFTQMQSREEAENLIHLIGIKKLRRLPRESASLLIHRAEGGFFHQAHLHLTTTLDERLRLARKIYPYHPIEDHVEGDIHIQRGFAILLHGTWPKSFSEKISALYGAALLDKDFFLGYVVPLLSKEDWEEIEWEVELYPKLKELSLEEYTLPTPKEKAPHIPPLMEMTTQEIEGHLKRALEEEDYYDALKPQLSKELFSYLMSIGVDCQELYWKKFKAPLPPPSQDEQSSDSLQSEIEREEELS